MECHQAYYEEGPDGKLIYGDFSVRAFPFRNTDLYPGFSDYEKRVLNSHVFDGSNTPSFDHVDELDKSLFLVSRIEWIFPENSSWNLFSMNALESSVARRETLAKDRSTGMGDQLENVVRNVPSWEISLPLFDLINTLHAFYSRHKPRNLRVISRKGLECVVSIDGTTRLVDEGIVRNLEVRSFFADKAVFESELHKDLPESGLETDHGRVVLDQTFEWTDRLDSGFIVEGSKKAIGGKWWIIAEADFDSSVTCPCGCNHD